MQDNLPSASAQAFSPISSNSKDPSMCRSGERTVVSSETSSNPLVKGGDCNNPTPLPTGVPTGLPTGSYIPSLPIFLCTPKGTSGAKRGLPPNGREEKKNPIHLFTMIPLPVFSTIMDIYPEADRPVQENRRALDRLRYLRCYAVAQASHHVWQKQVDAVADITLSHDPGENVTFLQGLGREQLHRLVAQDKLPNHFQNDRQVLSWVLDHHHFKGDIDAIIAVYNSLAERSAPYPFTSLPLPVILSQRLSFIEMYILSVIENNLRKKATPMPISRSRILKMLSGQFGNNRTMIDLTPTGAEDDPTEVVSEREQSWLRRKLDRLEKENVIYRQNVKRYKDASATFYGVVWQYKISGLVEFQRKVKEIEKMDRMQRTSRTINMFEGYGE